MGTRHEGSMPRPVKRAVTSAVEYGVARSVVASVRALDLDVIGQADQLPPATDGPFDAILAVNSLGFWPAPAERLAEPRRRLVPGGRIAIASQPRCPGATADTSRSAALEIEDLLRDAGFTHLSTQALPLSPPVACVLASS